MSTLGKSHSQVVKVVRVLGGAEETKAIAYARGGRNKQTIFLGQDAHEALGDVIYGYFEGELVAGKWWLGQRLPDSPNRHW
jgi:hypothetical protein